MIAFTQSNIDKKSYSIFFREDKCNKTDFLMCSVLFC